MLLISTGLKKIQLSTFPTTFNGGALFLFDGTRAAPDDPTPTPIAIVTSNGYAWNPTNTFNGLKFFQSDQYIFLDSVRQAIVTPIGAGGTARWWRLVAPGDTGDPSFNYPRVDGDIGLKASPSSPPEEILLNDTVLVAGKVFPLTYFLYTFSPIV